MKKKRASTAAKANSLLSPLPISSPDPFSNPTDFDLTFKPASSKKTLAPDRFLRSPLPPTAKTLATIADLKDLASSRTESLKRHLDHCHSESLKEIDASKTRIAKKFKIQTQACLQLTEEADKEYKKMADRIGENIELIKASYMEFITDAQATSSRASVSELAQAMEKAIESLGSRCKSLVLQSGQHSNSLMQLLNGICSISGDV